MTQRLRTTRPWMALLLAPLLFGCGSDTPTATEPDPDPEPDPQPSLVLLQTEGGEDSWAYAVSDGGRAVGMARDSEGRFLAVRWDPDGEAAVLLPETAGFGVGTGISHDGSVVAGYYGIGDNPFRAFRWTEDGGFDDLGTFEGARSLTWGISGDGRTIAGRADYPGVPSDAALWNVAGGPRLLGTLGEGNRAMASAVSFDGSVVVGSSRGQAGVSGDRAFRWTPTGGMTPLPGFPWDGQTRASGLSSDGSRVVGQATMENGDQRAVRWEGSSEPVVLDALGSAYTHHHALGLTSDGGAVVGRAAFDGNHTGGRAVSWDAEGRITDLNAAWADLIPAGWTLSVAWNISPGGRFIAGEAVSGDRIRGFLLDTEGR